MATAIVPTLDVLSPTAPLSPAGPPPEPALASPRPAVCEADAEAEAESSVSLLCDGVCVIVRSNGSRRRRHRRAVVGESRSEGVITHGVAFFGPASAGLIAFFSRARTRHDAILLPAHKQDGEKGHTPANNRSHALPISPSQFSWPPLCCTKPSSRSWPCATCFACRVSAMMASVDGAKSARSERWRAKAGRFFRRTPGRSHVSLFFGPLFFFSVRTSYGAWPG